MLVEQNTPDPYAGWPLKEPEVQSNEQPTIPQDSVQNGPYATVVTVRMSRKMHQALKDEAYKRRMSLNSLCLRALETTLPIDVQVRVSPSPLDC